MEGTRTSVWLLLLLLSQLSFCPTDADQNLVTEPPPSSDAHQGANSTTTAEHGTPTTTAEDSTAAEDSAAANGTRVDCLIDTEMGLIALGSAGGLIVCLLVTIVVLACQICVIQRRVYAPRTSRSNMDLVSGTGYWGVDRSEEGGLVGPCDASVMLEEVRADGEMEDERRAGGWEAKEEEEEAGAGREAKEEEEEAGAGREEGVPAMPDEENFSPMQSSRDPCLEIPRDLEDMPLVV